MASKCTMAVDGPDEDALALHDSALVRGLLICAGWVSVTLGAVGLVLPILPTTPFLLVAAACFARASPAFHRWLVGSPRFGPLIVEWRRHRSIPYRAKLAAIALFVLSLGTSILVFVRPAWLQAVMALGGCAMVVWLYRIPSRDRPR
jgi:uncharacterized membrane protein YbaN (DUF454 family)